MSRKQKLPREPVEAHVESLSHEGRGVAWVDGKTVFIWGALAGERVTFRYTRRRGRYDEGSVEEVLESAAQRISPCCPHFGLCGGCSLQHLAESAQIEHKQGVLLEQLQHIGHVEPREILPPLTGPTRGYRRKARLAVKLVPKKGGVLVGFRERNSPYVADISTCEVLHPSIGLILPELRILIAELSCSNRIPQIEVAIGDEDVALVFRHLDELTDEDRELLAKFGERHSFSIYLQPGGLDSVALLWPEESSGLNYVLGDGVTRFRFRPTDFTQVNSTINREMVQRAIEMLDVTESDHVLDLFCGLGNFSLALARKAARVTAVEGEAGLIERAGQNATLNQLDNVEFHVADLADTEVIELLTHRSCNKILLDPPRTGAQAVVEGLSFDGVERIVYVSCNPATLARDAGILVNLKGFELVSAGVMDMFPHTSHVESIVCFEKSVKS